MADQDKANGESFKPIKWLKSPSAAIYITYFMSSWGDRMWQFVIGLYLVLFDGGVLRLAAIYGFTRGICILFLGGPIGHWVDINPRLKVIRLALILQNLSVTLSAVGIAFMLIYHDYFYADPVNLTQRHLLEAVVMFLAIIAALCSTAYRVAIEKDWIVVVSSGDKAHLASLNATTRAIDLVSKALSPLIVAQVMTYGSRLMGALFIAVWNIVSVGVEYLLLMRVYRLVPRLRYKEANHPDADSSDQNEVEREKSFCEEERKQGDPQVSKKNRLLENASATKAEEDIDDELTIEQRRATTETDALSPPQEEPAQIKQPVRNRRKFVELLLGPFIQLIKGWSQYVRHGVCFAGLGLGFLYMTVLGFDSITVGYIYSQGISESILGVCTTLAAITGIIGTFIFTRFRKIIGLNKTGIFGFSFELLCLTLCLISIWTPGSPFGKKKLPDLNCSAISDESILNSSSSPFILTPMLLKTNESEGARDRRSLSEKLVLLSSDLSQVNVPLTLEGIAEGFYSRTKRAAQNINVNTSDTFIPYQVVGAEVGGALGSSEGPCLKQEEVPKTSVILFLVGIVVSRVGLWIADLSVTQTFQENVDEGQRGTLGGVQSSVNMLLDMIKFILVIFLPHIHTFGILIIVSFTFIILANAFFIIYTCRENDQCPVLFHSHTKPKPEVNIIYKPKDSSLITSKT